MKVIKRGFFRRIGAPGVSLLALTVVLVLTGPQAAWARKHHSLKTISGPDPTLVTACGTLSGNTVLYYLSGDISTASTGDCIVVAGDHNSLLLNGHTISYTGTPGTSVGAGISITGDHAMLEGFDGTVQGFETGITDSGDHTVGDDVNVTLNGTGLALTKQHERFFNFSVYSNTGTGISITGCNDLCSVADFLTYDNGGDGVLIQNSSNTAVDVFITADNGGSGVHLGGTTDGLGNSNVRVADAFLTGLTFLNSPFDAVSGNGGDGIFLDSSEDTALDQVTTVYSKGNTGFDLHDTTATCGSNLWYNNVFTTSEAAAVSSPACIN